MEKVMELKPFKREFVFPGLVAFISTRDEQGVRNIAPYSNIMPILRPLDLICVASWHKRDTLKNIRKTREFVVNIPPAGMVEKVIPTARHYPPKVDEFNLAELAARPSKAIQAPGIEGCLAWLECRLERQYVEKQYVLIIGRVVAFEMAEECTDVDGGINPSRAEPLMMLQNNLGMRFVTLKDIGHFEPYGAMFPDGRDPLERLYK
jgi:flavin reductase (DIM6/NTAB) family NADH-FMN oxidoreductase RutF